MDGIVEFKRFLIEKDNHHADYFMSMTSEYNSLKECFIIINDDKLVYRKSSKLRDDLKTEVVEKFKSLLGEKGYYSETD